MPVFKDEKNKKKWRVVFYHVNEKGEKIQKSKRGFNSKKEAKEWEMEYLCKYDYSLDMTFKSLCELYLEDISPRIRLNTLLTKKYILRDKVLPFFENVKVVDITPLKVRNWQNQLLMMIGINGKPLSQTYVKSINNQLTAILNYAVRFYGLKTNPCHRAGSIGKKNAEEMKFWTLEEFNRFVKYIEHKEVNFLGFQILFWCGIRVGELLALTVGDIDFNAKTLNINKSLQRLNKEDVVTAPKTKTGIRKIVVPDNVLELLKTFINKLYKRKATTRLFENRTKHLFAKDILTYYEKAGVPRIRVHDLRHSHASFLFSKEVDIITISKRLGHENIETTLKTYTHLYKTQLKKLKSALNEK